MIVEKLKEKNKYNKLKQSEFLKQIDLILKIILNYGWILLDKNVLFGHEGVLWT
jgi:hypothetical protein